MCDGQSSHIPPPYSMDTYCEIQKDGGKYCSSQKESTSKCLSIDSNIPWQYCYRHDFSRMPQGWMWAVMAAAMAVVKADEKTVNLWDDATPGMMQLEEFITNNTQAVSVFVTLM